MEKEKQSKRSAALKERWKDPEYRAKVAIGQRRRWQDPERRARGSDAQRRVWERDYWKRVQYLRDNVAKLTEEQVRAILRDDRSYEDIATEYKLCVLTVRDIKNRKIWKFPDDEEAE